MTALQIAATVTTTWVALGVASALLLSQAARNLRRTPREVEPTQQQLDDLYREVDEFLAAGS